MSDQLEHELSALEAEAERAEPGVAAHLFNRAGDKCLAAGWKQRAIAHYGRGIDANLYARRFDAAVGLCHKLLRIAPGAVRTRCTLAWLALGRGDVDEVARELDGYVNAAAAAGEGERAARHLMLMADAAPDAHVRELIAVHLERLGETRGAGLVRSAIDAARPAAARLTPEERDARWRACVTGALTGPHEL